MAQGYRLYGLYLPYAECKIKIECIYIYLERERLRKDTKGTKQRQLKLLLLLVHCETTKVISVRLIVYTNNFIYDTINLRLIIQLIEV